MPSLLNRTARPSASLKSTLPPLFVLFFALACPLTAGAAYKSLEGGGQSGNSFQFSGADNSNSGKTASPDGTAQNEEHGTSKTDGLVRDPGAGTTTYYDELIHNGADINISGNDQAVFLGDVSGAGNYTGTGTAYFEGNLMPGNSPALISMPNMTLTSTSTVIMELGGVLREPGCGVYNSCYDAFDVNGTLTINNATLKMAYWDGFVAAAGDTFDLFYADTVSGAFDTLNFSAIERWGIEWQLTHIVDYTGGTTDVLRLTAVDVAPVPLPPAAWLFGSALVGLFGLRRRRGGRPM
ncbi:MAG: hypothetical protein ABW148_17370 [Sedimenticola sp.]